MKYSLLTVCSSFLANAENPSVPIREASILDDTDIFDAVYNCHCAARGSQERGDED